MTTTFHPPDIEQPARRECPYNGLQAYTEADSDYFYGRDADRDLVIANLMASRLTILYGPSGVGKSSLLQAGVIPHLRALAHSSFSYVVTSRAIVAYHASWRDDPLVDLAQSLRAAMPADIKRDELLPAGPLTTSNLQAITQHLDADVYLLCDQFEEATLYHDGARIEAFATELGQIVGTPGVRVNVLLGVREDALAKLDRLEAYVSDLFGNSLRLDHLSLAAAREAIEKPLGRYNETHRGHPVSIEPALVDRLLGELRTGRVSVTDSGQGSALAESNTIETPFLQLVMTRLWAEEISHGSSVITESTLRGLGGASRIVRTHLDAVMNQLPRGQQAIAAHVFRHLVTPSGTKIAHTAEDLADYAGLTDVAPLSAMLEELASGDDRVLRPVPPPVDQPGPPRYEIFHDVMAPAVLDWRRRFIAEQDRLASEAELVRARREAEEQHRRTRRRLRRSRLLSAALALLLVAAVVSVIWAKHSSDAAKAGRKQAVAARFQADAARWLAEYEHQLPSDPANALHAALQAYSVRRTPEAEAAVRSALDADNQLQVLKGHSGIVSSSEFAPDGMSVVTAGFDGTAQIFNVETGNRIHVLAPPTGMAQPPLDSASFSPTSGAMVATAASDGTVTTYTAAGELIRSSTLFRKPVKTVWTQQNGTQDLLISSLGSESKPAILWNPEENRTVARYGADGTTQSDAMMSPNGHELVTIGSGGALTVWDTASQQALATSQAMGEVKFPHFVMSTSTRIALLARQTGSSGWKLFMWDWKASGKPKQIPYSYTGEAVDLAVSRNGKWVAMANDKTATVYDVTASRAEDISAVGYTADQPDLINTIDLSPDGHWLLTGNADGRAQIWLATHPGNNDAVAVFGSRPLVQFVGPRGSVLAAKFNPRNPAQVTTANTDGAAHIWQFNQATTLYPDRYGPVVDAEYSSDGKQVVTAQVDGYYEVRDIATGKRIAHWWDDSYDTGPRSAQFAPTGDLVVTAAQTAFAPQVWESSTGNEREQTLTAEPGLISSNAAVSADGSQVAVGDYDNRVVEWSLETGSIISTSASNAPWSVTAVRYVPHTDLVAAASTDGTVRVWHSGYLAEKPRVFGKAGTSPIDALAVSTDGAQLIAVNDAHMIDVWRLSDGEQIQSPLEGPNTTVSAVAFSPNGRYVASADGDATVYIWETSHWQRVAIIQGYHGDLINSVQFGKDSEHILTGSDDGTSAVLTCSTCADFPTVLARAEQLDQRHQRQS